MARTAEAAGLDSLWLGDHLLYDLARRGHPWAVGGLDLARRPRRRDLARGARPVRRVDGFHAPPMLAKMAATVDAISGGRLILGLGAGWNEREYTAFGFPFDHRISRFEEAFTVIRTLLRDGRIDFHGAYYDVADCVLDPHPPGPAALRCILGSTGPRMMRIGLPHADLWNVWWSELRQLGRRFVAARENGSRRRREAGRAPGDVGATAAVLRPARRRRRAGDG